MSAAKIPKKTQKNPAVTATKERFNRFSVVPLLVMILCSSQFRLLS